MNDTCVCGHARAAALKALREAHDKAVEELIAAEAWLKDQGLDDGPGDEYPLTWPHRIEEEELDGLVDFGSEFDEMTANLEEAIEKQKLREGLEKVARATLESRANHPPVKEEEKP